MNSKHAEKLPCPVCQGTKRVRRRDKNFCERCGGNGWVEGMFGRVLTCKKCGGNGHVIDFFDDVCLNCEGRGWVVRMVPDCPKCGKPMDQCTCRAPVPPGEPA